MRVPAAKGLEWVYLACCDFIVRAAGAKFSLDGDGNLNQIAVGIAQINGAKFPDGAVAFDRARFDVDFLLFQILHHGVERGRREEAEVGGSRRWMRRFGFELMSALVQVQSLDAEGERFAAVHLDEIHSQDFRVEIDGGINVGHSENEVIQMLQDKCHMRTMLEHFHLYCVVLRAI